MFIPRIHDASPNTSPHAPGRRRPRQFVFNLERLEVRTPLSAGFGTSLATLDAAVAPAPGRAATTIAEGLSIGPVNDGPAPMAPAAPVDVQGDLRLDLPVFGPVGLATFPGRGDELQSEAVWAAVGASASNSNGASNFSIANTGMSGRFVAPAGFLTVEIVVSVGADPIGPGGSAHAPAPGGAMDLTQPGVMPPLFFDPERSGPVSGMYGPEGGVASPIPRGLVARLETNGNDADAAFSAPMSSNQASAISQLQMMAVDVAGGLAASGKSMQGSGGLSTQINSASEPVGGGWMSYVAGGNWDSGGMQPPSSSVADWTTAADNVGETISPAAIMAGGAPLSVLLTGPESPTQTTSDDLQQVAELIPSEESSLALVATLWTVPSDIPTGAHEVQRLDATAARLDDAAATPSWMAYMIGLDQALEQSHRDLQQVVSPARGRLMPDERDLLELDRQLEWERPIIPVGAGWVSDRPETSPRDRASVVDSDAINALAADRLQTASGLESSRPAVAGEDAPPHSEPASIVKAASLPLLSALSASTAITGWLWTRRNRKRRLGLPGLAGGATNPFRP